jgi:hypothetical protein
MSKYFHFHYPNHEYDVQLQSWQCAHLKPDDTYCKRRVVIGLPLCYQHTASDYKLKIKESSIPNAGLGLYAYDKTKEIGDIVFDFNNRTKKGVKICPYFGEVIDEPTLISRYGQYTAPYGIKLNNGLYEDGARERGIGSLLNHKNKIHCNCKFSVGRDNRIYIVSTKKIKNGDELFVNYGRDYKFNDPVQTSTNRNKLKV